MSADAKSLGDVGAGGRHALLASFVANRWWIVGSAIFFAAAFAIAAFAMTPTYRASAILISAASDRGTEVLGSALGSLGGIASIVGINVGADRQETEEALTILRSRQFTESFINDRNLMPKLFANKWDSAGGKWKGGAPTPAKAYRMFNEKVRRATQDKKTGLVTLSIDWSDRNEAAEWANELAQRLNEEMRARAIAKSEASLGYLEKELQSTTAVATREAISRLIEAQVKQRMLANVTHEYAFRIVDKAMAPDEDDPLRPRRLKMIAAGPMVGITLAVLWILTVGALRSEWASE